MKSLKDKYCIVGVGETEYSRNSGRTTRAMAVDAIRKRFGGQAVDYGSVSKVGRSVPDEFRRLAEREL